MGEALVPASDARRGAWLEALRAAEPDETSSPRASAILEPNFASLVDESLAMPGPALATVLTAGPTVALAGALTASATEVDEQ
jgi:hypothetical protein